MLEEITINLNTATRSQIEQFMLKNSLFTCADIGREVDLSRERVRQIFQNRSDLDFKEIKRKLVKNKFSDKKISTTKYNWREISFVTTKYPYYVSECGKVARDISRKKHGIEVVERKLLKASANKNKHLRVNLTVQNPDKTCEHKTFYLHQIVANTWLDKPDSNRRLKGVKPIDGNIENCTVTNLAWSYFN